MENIISRDTNSEVDVHCVTETGRNQNLNVQCLVIHYPDQTDR